MKENGVKYGLCCKHICTSIALSLQQVQSRRQESSYCRQVISESGSSVNQRETKYTHNIGTRCSRIHSTPVTVMHVYMYVHMSTVHVYVAGSFSTLRLFVCGLVTLVSFLASVLNTELSCMSM